MGMGPSCQRDLAQGADVACHRVLAHRSAICYQHARPHALGKDLQEENGSERALRLVEIPSPQQKRAHWHQAVCSARVWEAATLLRTCCWQRYH
eukprot:14005467-Ditylum_brightwellii.AAC.1